MRKNINKIIIFILWQDRKIFRLDLEDLRFIGRDVNMLRTFLPFLLGSGFISVYGCNPKYCKTLYIEVRSTFLCEGMCFVYVCVWQKHNLGFLWGWNIFVEHQVLPLLLILCAYSPQALWYRVFPFLNKKTHGVCCWWGKG